MVVWYEVKSHTCHDQRKDWVCLTQIWKWPAITIINSVDAHKEKKKPSNYDSSFFFAEWQQAV